MAGTNQTPSRPLSPHLQIYRPEINMVMSIVHRITGVALYLGTILLAWWLLAAASGPAYFDYVNGLWASIPGRVVLLGYTWALIHHALGGIRHLIWDTGRALDIVSVDRLSWMTILGSSALTVLVWVAGYWMGERSEMAAHAGSGHFKRQRLTAVLLLPLVLFLVGLLVSLVGADHPTVVRQLASPLVWLPLLALVLTGSWHMWLGMQVIIDDYMVGGARSVLLTLSSTFAILTALVAVYAIYQLSFGA